MTHPAAANTMRAMVFDAPGRPLRAVERAVPEPAAGDALVRVEACGVCRTDLHLLDGELPVPDPPRVLGHQIVGVVERAGEAAPHPPGTRVGVPWLGWTCGVCAYCSEGRENLSPRARFTGRDMDGGMADYATADARYCFELPREPPAEQLAPLLCAGLIGYRALRFCGPPLQGARLGLYGFGAAAHIVAQVARARGWRVHAVTRPGDEPAQELALALGAEWAGGSDEPPPGPLLAAIVFASAGPLVPLALRALAPGGRVVCAGIHMSDVPSFPYEILWGERSVCSVANLTRADALEMLELAPLVPVRTHVSTYRLEEAEAALDDLRAGRVTGAAVILP
jgi:propanol-preferring alcohol dehydrogenase